MNKARLLAAATLSLATAAHATITLTDGDAVFTMRDGTFTGGNWAGDLFVDDSGDDHLFRNQWYYRSQINSFEHELGSDNNTAEGATGNTGFIEWAEGGFEWRLDLTLTDTGAGTARVDQVMRISNVSGEARTITMFNYSDIEFGGFLEPNTAKRDADGFTVNNLSIPDRVAKHLDFGAADAWQLADANDIIDELEDFDADVLTNTNTIAFDDMSGAFQFDLSIPNGRSLTVITAIEIVPVGGCNAADLAEPLGTLNVDDIDAFVASFLASDPDADCDGSGVLNVDDIDCFVAAFLAGCG